MAVFRLPKTGDSSGADDIGPPGTQPVTGTGSGDSGGGAWTRFGEDPDYADDPPSRNNNSQDQDDGDSESGETTMTTTVSPQSTGTPTLVGSGSTSTDVSDGATQTPTVVSAPINSSALLPAWAIVLIIVGAVMALIFIVSLCFFCVRERRRRYEQQSKNTSYGRAVGRALAAATGAFVPIWIAKRLCGRKKRSSKTREGRAQQDGGSYAKIETLLDHHEQSQSSLSYVSPAPAPAPTPVPPPAYSTMPAPAPVPQQVRRTPSLVSALSADSARGRYERVETSSSHPLADAPSRDGGGAATAGLYRNPSLVSALSSIDERRYYSTSEIPPPTPMSESASTFGSPERSFSARARENMAARQFARYGP